MSRKLKTRFFATVDGVDKEMFSVREVKNGELQILHKGPGFSRRSDGFHCSTHEDKQSVHISNLKNPKPDCTYRTLTSTLRTGDGAVSKSHALIECPGDFFLFPLFSHRYGAIEDEIHTMQASSKDHLHKLADVSSSEVTLTVLYLSRENMKMGFTGILPISVPRSRTLKNLQYSY